MDLTSGFRRYLEEMEQCDLSTGHYSVGTCGISLSAAAFYNKLFFFFTLCRTVPQRLRFLSEGCLYVAFMRHHEVKTSSALALTEEHGDSCKPGHSSLFLTYMVRSVITEKMTGSFIDNYNKFSKN